MKASSSFSKIVDIRDLVDHMYEKSRDAFTVDGVTDESFRIYHDALSQLTDSACQKYIQDKGYHKYFILPVLGCNDVIRNSKGGINIKFKGRNIGDSPELMPLDTSIFADLMRAIHYHVARTRCFRSDSKYKFSVATPLKVESVVSRLWNKDAIPIARINQDIERVAEAMKVIVSQRGVVVYGWGDRNGWRSIKLQEYCSVLNKDFAELSRKGKHGGLRVKAETYKTMYSHPDVKMGLDEIIDLDEDVHDAADPEPFEAFVLDEPEDGDNDDVEDGGGGGGSNSNTHGNSNNEVPQESDDPDDPDLHAKYYRFDDDNMDDGNMKVHYCAYPGCTTRFTAVYLHTKHFYRVHVKNLKKAEKDDKHSE